MFLVNFSKNLRVEIFRGFTHSDPYLFWDFLFSAEYFDQVSMKTLYGTKYLRVGQVKFVKDSL